MLSPSTTSSWHKALCANENERRWSGCIVWYHQESKHAYNRYINILISAIESLFWDLQQTGKDEIYVFSRHEKFNKDTVMNATAFISGSRQPIQTICLKWYEWGWQWLSGEIEAYPQYANNFKWALSSGMPEETLTVQPSDWQSRRDSDHSAIRLAVHSLSNSRYPTLPCFSHIYIMSNNLW